jgi:transcriptional regulator with XRE-family HTH domain
MLRRKRSDPAPALDAGLLDIRKWLGLTQREMAKRMGLSLSPYQALELDPAKVLKRHKLLAEYVAVQLAFERGDFSLFPLTLQAKKPHFMQRLAAGETSQPR